MALLGWLFIRGVFADYLPADQLEAYIAGLILLAAAPCTAMVFVSGAALATVVGVLVEVSVMLSVVKIVNPSRDWYECGAAASRR